MNKSELIKKISESAGISQQQAKRALEAFIESVTVAIKRGERVSITGFGSFKLRERPARTGRNPQTGEIIEIRASKYLVFTAGKKLKSAIMSRLPTGGGGPGIGED